jgi:hypothetical protein
MMKTKILIAFFSTLLLATASHAFETVSLRGNAESTVEWTPPFPINYFIHNNGTTDVPGTNERNQLKLGLNRWNPVSPFKFRFAGLTNSVPQGDLKNGIIFDGQNFDGSSSTLAFCEILTFIANPRQRAEADIHFNDRDVTWTTGASNPNQNRYKILPTAVHELGHSVGLGHTAIFEATMFFADQGADIGETLHPDDIAGAKFLYAARQNTLAVPKLITPVDNSQHRLLSIGQSANGITFRWEQNTALNLSAFSLEFAGNNTFTQGFRKFNAAAKLAFFMGPGARMNALRTIQRNSPLGKVFWRVSAKTPSGSVVRSAVQSITLQ